MRELARKGLLVTDADEPVLTALRRRDELLTASAWNLDGAACHFMTKREGVDLRPGDGAQDLPPLRLEAIEAFVAERGAPPPAFHSVASAIAVEPLPAVPSPDGLYATLHERKTTRGFDVTKPLAREELAAILWHVWGCHGQASVTEGVVTLKKTSPRRAACTRSRSIRS